MPRPRAPWWIYILAASFLGYFALREYCDLWGPEPLGAGVQYGPGSMLLRSVSPNSPVERAGLKAGDRVLAVDGLPTRNLADWAMVRANHEIGRPRHLQIQRGSEQREVVITLGRTTRSNWDLSDWTDLGARVLTLILAFVIIFSRPYDLVARMGAWFLAGVSVATPLPPAGISAILRQLPMPLGGLLWICGSSVLVLPAVLFTFFAIFPRPLFRQRWAWVLVWTPSLLAYPPLALWFYRVAYQPERAPGNLDRLLAIFVWTFLAYIVGGLVALVLNYRRLEDVNERRRVRVLVVGSLVGWVAALPLLVVVYLLPSRAPAFFASPAALLPSVFGLAFPLSFAYAVLRHRLFDVRVMIRQGLQYAVARGALVSAVPALAAIFLLDLLLHGDQPAVAILRARGWIYVGLGALALVGQVRQKQWLAALDRRFFRERYDAQRLLREVVEELREAGSFERVAPRVVARVEAALHPEFVALLVRDPREASYRSLAAAPAGQAPPPLRAESKLLALVRVLGKPLEVSLTESGWLKQQLPHEETDFLRQARIDLLVPIAVDPERREALLALGVKRSEEPYTRENQDLLVAIATSLALLLEKPAAVAVTPSEALEECPRCGTCYDTGAGRCAQEGANLVPMHLPRLLAERYKLERRRGRGGMGTVYEALDTALERRVAVKVIRDDLVGSAEAAERFRREARAAASFTHPNVVTVYDFGVAADTRAFLVMELLDGSSLREELQKNKTLPAERTLEILRGVCAAVEAAHRRQLIHRDLKPENIFLARGEAGETAKVLDFGIAKFLPTATQATADTGSTMLVGTVRYMAPEHLRGEPAHAAWDLWALAVVAYEMLTGAQPFAGTTVAECHSAVLAGRFTSVATHLPEAPARWQEFFARAFALERDRRPSSAGVFVSQLVRALA